jgi:methylenetetrahydrofolate--tRNA-(uracil-5-)-methyltransferase
MRKQVHIIGGGLAGCEAAWQVATAGIGVVLHEMRPDRQTEAHKTGRLAELVCSNSFRSDDAGRQAIGLLHAEMRLMSSLIMRCADQNKVPAGSALAVDRERFADSVSAAIAAHPLIDLQSGEVVEIGEDWSSCIVATGPLTSAALAEAIRRRTGEASLAFFDAIAPIVHRDSIDMEKAWFQSRYDKPGPGGTGADYINCPLDRTEYDRFLGAILAAETGEFREFEKDTPYFEGCLPIEIMAARGRETLRYGPMKPVGLTNPRNPDVKPHAIVQLRQDNALGTLYNIVGFQTKMKYASQAAVLRLIPGLENAEFARLGGIHRNTYLNSPRILDRHLRLKTEPRLRFAGQITGCEGYVESAAIGLIAGRLAAAEAAGHQIALPPATTAIGALLNHITGGHIADDSVENEAGRTRSFQPMNVNFGLFPPVEAPARDADGRRLKGPERGVARKTLLSARALRDLELWLGASGTAGTKTAAE